jgi:two-component system, OmpR family, response regulator
LSWHAGRQPDSIMLVDDELDLVDVLAFGLENEGYSVDSFEDSNEAIANFKETPNKYSVVIADIRMEHMDGIELAKEILAICANIRIIFITAMEIKGSIRRKLNEIPQYELLLKPFSFADLQAKLKWQKYAVS